MSTFFTLYLFIYNSYYLFLNGLLKSMPREGKVRERKVFLFTSAFHSLKIFPPEAAFDPI